MMKQTVSKAMIIGLALMLITMSLFYYGLSRVILKKVTEEVSRAIQTISNDHDTQIENMLRLEKPVDVDAVLETEEKRLRNAPGPQTQKPTEKDPAEGNGKDDNDKPYVPPAAEKPPPPTRHALFGYMPLEDQAFMIELSNRFSLSEIRMIVEAHQAGGDSWEAAKVLIMEKVSQSEIDRVLFLIDEYML
jgi:hypothetical protein